MTKEQMRIAIAKACGFYRRKIGDTERDGWVSPTDRASVAVPVDDLPNYPDDLNACAEFEAIVDDKMYSDRLMNIIFDDPGWIKGVVEARYRTAKATASQRCEAFLRVKGLWKD